MQIAAPARAAAGKMAQRQAGPDTKARMASRARSAAGMSQKPEALSDGLMLASTMTGRGSIISPSRRVSRASPRRQKRVATMAASTMLEDSAGTGCRRVWSANPAESTRRHFRSHSVRMKASASR